MIILALEAIKLLLVGSTRETIVLEFMVLEVHRRWTFLKQNLCCKKHTHDTSKALLFYVVTPFFMKEAKIFR
jgi:hypothetical protein